MSQHQNPVILTALSLDLGRCTLGTLLALDSLSLTALCRPLRLLSLLLGLQLGLLVLALFDRLRACCGAGFGSHGTALFDDVEGGTDDGALVLDGAAGTLLGYFLYRGDKVLVAGSRDMGS
jgi:hypothetical protein